MLWLCLWATLAHVVPDRLCGVRAIIRGRHNEMDVFFSRSKMPRRRTPLSRPFYGSWRLLSESDHGGSTPRRYVPSETNVTRRVDTAWKDRSLVCFLVAGLRHPTQDDAFAALSPRAAIEE